MSITPARGPLFEPNVLPIFYHIFLWDTAMGNGGQKELAVIDQQNVLKQYLKELEEHRHPKRSLRLQNSLST
jgi:hypothetical protein